MNSHGRADEILSSWCEVINDSFESLGIADKRIGIARKIENDEYLLFVKLSRLKVKGTHQKINQTMAEQG